MLALKRLGPSVRQLQIVNCFPFFLVVEFNSWTTFGSKIYHTTEYISNLSTHRIRRHYRNKLTNPAKDIKSKAVRPLFAWQSVARCMRIIILFAGFCLLWLQYKITIIELCIVLSF